jgi:dipeptide/tripeptide permease
VAEDGTQDTVQRLKDLSSIGTSQARRAVFLLFIAPIAEFAFGLVDLIGTIFDLFIVPAQSFLQGIGELILSIVGGAADIVGAGSSAAVRAFLTGIWSALGPLAFPVSIGIAGLGALVLARIVAERETSDSIFGLFSSTDFPDIPFLRVGAEEEDEEGGE